MRSLLLVVALCVLSANAYVNPAGKYYFYSRLNPSNAYTLATGENNNNVGYFWGELESSSLTFHLLWTQKDVTRVSINGPVKCINNGNTFYTFNGGGGTDCNPSFNNNASIIWDLGPVQSYATKQISLSVEQILMLFNAEMDIVIATEPRPTGALRGQIRPFGRYFGSLQNSQILQLVRFEGNDGKYDPEAEVKSAGTASVGFGLIYHNLNQNPPRLDYRIMTNIETPGALSIRCPSLGSDTVTKDTNNPVETSKTFTDKPELVLESLVSKKCYYYFRSAAYPEGELYAYPETLVPFQVDAYPGSMVPPVSSPNFATFIVDYDTATNVLDASLVTNITDPANSITSVDAYYTNENSDGVWACNLYTQAATNPQNPVGNRIYCRVNTTYEEPLLNKRFYFVLSTTTNPNGEMRGDLSSNGMAASSGGLSDTAKIAIGATVGAVVGVALIGGLIYLGVKKGAFSRSGKL